MEEKEIYLIRHGETDHNLKGLVQGSGIDAPLNARGRAQAKAFFDEYHHLPFDKIYTSTLSRAIQTVESFIRLGIPHEQDAALNEICWGRFEGQSINHAHRPYFDELMAHWRNGDLHLSIEGGESPLEVANRQRPFIDKMLSRTDEKTVLVCMHGRAMRIFLCLLLGKPLQFMERYLHANLSLYHLRYSGGQMHLIKENNRQHLEE